MPEGQEEELEAGTTRARSPSVKIVKQKPIEGERLWGRVLEGTGRWWMVELEDSPGTILECSVAGTVTVADPSSTLIAVGDRVECIRTGKETPSGLPGGVIVAVGPRLRKLERYRRREGKEQVIASNVEQLVILQAVEAPPYDRFLIDRYLIAAAKGDLKPILCVNKIDLGDAARVRQELAYYAHALGIPLVLCSARTGEGIEELRAVLKGKLSVLAGPSGVGKSTLTNLLLGREVQQVGEVSQKLGRGRHITTMARMLRLPEGGYIVDTPGIQDLTLWELTQEELPFYFPDFQPWAQECHYQPCFHIHEPNCRVREAVAEGRIDPLRYEHYRRLWQSLPKYHYQWRTRQR